MNTAAIVTDTIDSAPSGSFLRPEDIKGVPEPAVHMAFSRAVRERPDLVRVARGLYWKGRPSRFGPVLPDATAVARSQAGERGVGPTGWLAANELGLSTQVPARPALSTVARPPKLPGPVAFSRRANLARVDLTYPEIALIEVLRSYPDYVEVPWERVVDRVKDLTANGTIRLDAVVRAASTERSAALKRNLSRLRAALSA